MYEDSWRSLSETQLAALATALGDGTGVVVARALARQLGIAEERARTALARMRRCGGWACPVTYGTCARAAKLRRYSVRGRAYDRAQYALTLPLADQHRQPWTLEELAYLESHQTVAAADVALALGRTVHAIRDMRRLTRLSGAGRC